jgi:DNA-binding transcriptional MerR regulator
LVEYRLEELARISGVSARNIRAYRERGLLDPPRREGRSAYYDDYHLSQLQTINQLLRRGFNSAHIAEFFASFREGYDLADVLGIQRVIFAPPRDVAQTPDRTREPAGAASPALDLDPESAEVKRLVEFGLAATVDGAVVLVDPVMGAIVARASNQLSYVQAILQLYESTRETIDQLATEVIDSLKDCVLSRFGSNFMPKPGEMTEVGQIVQDYRELGRQAVTRQLNEALRRRAVAAMSDYTTELLAGGHWVPKIQ